MFVAHYVITDQSDCSIGVQYIARFCSFTSFTFYAEGCFFCFPIRMAFLKCNRCNKSDIGYIYSCNMRPYFALVCVFLHLARLGQNHKLVQHMGAYCTLMYPISYTCMYVCMYLYICMYHGKYIMYMYVYMYVSICIYKYMGCYFM